MVAKIPRLGYPLDIEQSLIRQNSIISHVHIAHWQYNLKIGHRVLASYEGLNMSKLYFYRFLSSRSTCCNTLCTDCSVKKTLRSIEEFSLIVLCFLRTRTLP
jgi:hypothetical protein